MSDRERWESRYQEGSISWDLGRPDKNLQHLIKSLGISPCKVLEIGCGTGDNAIWLAGQGFKVTGIDISSTAIRFAKRKKRDSGVSCYFVVADILTDDLQESFDMIYDRGCFHSFDHLEERLAFCRNLANHLNPDGYWISIIGNADDEPRETGPPMRSARDVVLAVEPFFEIYRLERGYFDSNSSRPALAWFGIFRKRKIPG